MKTPDMYICSSLAVIRSANIIVSLCFHSGSGLLNLSVEVKIDSVALVQKMLNLQIHKSAIGFHIEIRFVGLKLECSLIIVGFLVDGS